MFLLLDVLEHLLHAIECPVLRSVGSWMGSLVPPSWWREERKSRTQPLSVRWRVASYGGNGPVNKGIEGIEDLRDKSHQSWTCRTQKSGKIIVKHGNQGQKTPQDRQFSYQHRAKCTQWPAERAVGSFGRGKSKKKPSKWLAWSADIPQVWLVDQDLRLGILTYQSQPRACPWSQLRKSIRGPWFVLAWGRIDHTCYVWNFTLSVWERGTDDRWQMSESIYWSLQDV